MSMYVRVKRQKTTWFVHCEPSDTAADLKMKLHQMAGQPAEQQRLFRGDGDSAPLDDARPLSEQAVENDDVLAVAYQREDGTWEDVEVTPPESGGPDDMA